MKGKPRKRGGTSTMRGERNRSMSTLSRRFRVFLRYVLLLDLASSGTPIGLSP